MTRFHNLFLLCFAAYLAISPVAALAQLSVSSSQNSGIDISWSPPANAVNSLLACSFEYFDHDGVEQVDYLLRNDGSLEKVGAVLMQQDYFNTHSLYGIQGGTDEHPVGSFNPIGVGQWASNNNVGLFEFEGRANVGYSQEGGTIVEGPHDITPDEIHYQVDRWNFKPMRSASSDSASPVGRYYVVIQPQHDLSEFGYDLKHLSFQTNIIPVSPDTVGSPRQDYQVYVRVYDGYEYGSSLRFDSRDRIHSFAGVGLGGADPPFVFLDLTGWEISPNRELNHYGHQRQYMLDIEDFTDAVVIQYEISLTGFSGAYQPLHFVLQMDDVVFYYDSPDLSLDALNQELNSDGLPEFWLDDNYGSVSSYPHSFIAAQPVGVDAVAPLSTVTGLQTNEVDVPLSRQSAYIFDFEDYATETYTPSSFNRDPRHPTGSGWLSFGLPSTSLQDYSGLLPFLEHEEIMTSLNTDIIVDTIRRDTNTGIADGDMVYSVRDSSGDIISNIDETYLSFDDTGDTNTVDIEKSLQLVNNLIAGLEAAVVNVDVSLFLTALENTATVSITGTVTDWMYYSIDTVRRTLGIDSDSSSEVFYLINQNQGIQSDVEYACVVSFLTVTEGVSDDSNGSSGLHTLVYDLASGTIPMDQVRYVAPAIELRPEAIMYEHEDYFDVVYTWSPLTSADDSENYAVSFFLLDNVPDAAETELFADNYVECRLEYNLIHEGANIHRSALLGHELQLQQNLRDNSGDTRQDVLNGDSVMIGVTRPMLDGEVQCTATPNNGDPMFIIHEFTIDLANPIVRFVELALGKIGIDSAGEGGRFLGTEVIVAFLILTTSFVVSRKNITVSIIVFVSSLGIAQVFGLASLPTEIFSMIIFFAAIVLFHRRGQ